MEVKNNSVTGRFQNEKEQIRKKQQYFSFKWKNKWNIKVIGDK
jgi:hypothetical protein